MQTAHLEAEHNLFFQRASEGLEYDSRESTYIATYMEEIENITTKSETCMSQQHLLEKGLKIFGKKGYDAILKEMGQLDDRKCFEPVSVKEMSNSERRKAQIALAYLTEK